jgi:hypothetical protein
VRGGGSFAGEYKANGLADHGGPSKANGRLPPPLFPFSSPRCPNLSPRSLLQTLATSDFLQILVDSGLVRSRQLWGAQRSAQGGDHGPCQLPVPSSVPSSSLDPLLYFLCAHETLAATAARRQQWLSGQLASNVQEGNEAGGGLAGGGGASKSR